MFHLLGVMNAQPDRIHSSSARILCVVAGAGCLLGVSSAAGAVLLDDQFTDNERLTQSLPGSAQWTVGAHRETSGAFGTLTVTGQKMVLDHTASAGVNSFAAIWGHFTASGSPVTIAVGETMTLSFNVAYTGAGSFTTATGAFRFALLNSGGSRVTTDFAGVNSTGISSGTTFSGWRGYEGQTPVNNTLGTGSFLTRERTGSGSGLFSSSEWASLSGSGQATEPLFAPDTEYAGSLSLTRTMTGMTVQANLAGVSTVAVTDTATPFTAFDTVAFFALDIPSYDLTFDNIKVEVIPEPSVVMLGGLAGLGLLLRSRRR